MVANMRMFRKQRTGTYGKLPITVIAAVLLLLSGCTGAPREESRETGGISLFARYDPDEEKYGYRGETDEWVIEPSFDFADDFSENGLARVQSDGKWGFIDESGAYRAEPQFDYAGSFAENGTAVVAVGCKTDLRGNLLGGKWGYIAEDGSFLIDPCFEWADSFEEDGRAWVLLNGQYGTIDRAGEFTADR